ncbi:acyl-CoA dehydrogenase family protein [Streptomyces sp. NPDC048191]|uniref:acyl-CoA dehydrogenase family protein n=1 Tax=Streptomyces sp. NPDC048191 TaxID=3155484 RepID=UPI0033F6A2B8
MSDLPTELVPLRPEQRGVVALARTFARAETRPRARAVDEADVETPWDLWREAAAAGITESCYYGTLPHLPLGPEGRYLHPTGFGTLGHALPAALGAKVAAPHDLPALARTHGGHGTGACGPSALARAVTEAPGRPGRTTLITVPEETP